MWNAASACSRHCRRAIAAALASALLLGGASLAVAASGGGNRRHVPPTDPSNVAVSAATGSSITVNWTPSTDRIGVAGYNLYSDTVKFGTTTQTNAVFSGYSCGTSHRIGIQAFDAAGNVSQITTITASTVPCPDTLAPSAPTNLVETASTTTSISFSWNASTDNVAVAGYDVFINDVKAGTSLTTSFTAGGLACGTVYSVGVDAYDAAGNHSLTSTMSGKTALCASQTSAPTNSTPPTISGTTQAGQTVSASTGTWTGSPSSYAYQWERCNSSGASCASIAGANTQHYALTTSDVNTTMRVNVTAVNSAGSATATSAQTAVVTSAPTTSSSIYWGAYIEGRQTYNYIYGGTWSNAPWCDSGTQCPLPRFKQNAGKQPSVEHWGMCWTCSFDSGIAKVVVGRGDIPAVDWSTEGATDAAIASGHYDSWLTSQAQAMAAFGHPMFLLLDEEMNGTWYGYSPGNNGNTASDFVAMWRHIHDVFVANGATNVTWAWVPNVDPFGVYTSLSSLYPGDAYVDWTGLNGYNWGGGAGGGWMTFQQVFSSSYNALLSLAPAKPVIIGEVASEENGGSKASWITDALSTELPQKFPRIKAVLWFNWRIYEKSQYWNWEIESSSGSQQAFATAIGSPYYAPGGTFGGLPLLTKVQPLP